MAEKSRKETGSILIFTLFILLAIMILVLAYLKLTQTNARLAILRSGEIKAYYAAYAGIQDAIYELKSAKTWSDTNIGSGATNLDPQWHHLASDPANTLYKSTVTPTDPLPAFSYPTTFSVTVDFSGVPYSGTINVVSSAEVSPPNGLGMTFRSQLAAALVRTPANDVVVLSMGKP